MQRNEFQNYADEGTRILDDTPGGEEGESALRKFLKVSTNEINNVCLPPFWGVDKELIWRSEERRVGKEC